MPVPNLFFSYHTPVPNLAVIHQEYRTGQVSKRFEIMVSQTWQPKQQQAGQQTLVEERG